MKIVEAESGMYRLTLPNGRLSILYNKTRATEFVRLVENGTSWENIRIGYTTQKQNALCDPEDAPWCV